MRAAPGSQTGPGWRPAARGASGERRADVPGTGWLQAGQVIFRQPTYRVFTLRPDGQGHFLRRNRSRRYAIAP